MAKRLIIIIFFFSQIGLLTEFSSHSLWRNRLVFVWSVITVEFQNFLEKIGEADTGNHGQKNFP